MILYILIILSVAVTIVKSSVKRRTPRYRSINERTYLQLTDKHQ